LSTRKRSSPEFLPEPFIVWVNPEGLVPIPAQVSEELGLESGELFAVTRLAISVRLERFRELHEDLRDSVRGEEPSLSLEGVSRQRAVAREGGGVGISLKLLGLRPGDKVAVELAEEGVRRALYIYRADA
jgi:bifunctional DNA-binding transcriptional regulator/antitoxin component of YhaV-PrlF toxin-antitoxin module